MAKKKDNNTSENMTRADHFEQSFKMIQDIGESEKRESLMNALKKSSMINLEGKSEVNKENYSKNPGPSELGVSLDDLLKYKVILKKAECVEVIRFYDDPKYSLKVFKKISKGEVYDKIFKRTITRTNSEASHVFCYSEIEILSGKTLKLKLPKV